MQKCNMCAGYEKCHTNRYIYKIDESCDRQFWECCYSCLNYIACISIYNVKPTEYCDFYDTNIESEQDFIKVINYLRNELS